MRILDLADSWSANTYAAYNGKLRFLTQFEQYHNDLYVLPVIQLDRPPHHQSIALSWAEEFFTL